MNSQSTKPLTPQKFHLPSSPFHLPPPGFGALGRGNHLGTVLVGWWMVCVALAFVPSHIYLSALAQNQPSRAGDLAHAESYWVTRASWAEGRAEEGGKREGWSEGKGTECLAGRRGADQFSPLAYQSCPLTLSVSADDTLSLPIGPFPGQEKGKKRRRRWRCVHWPQSCMFERACREGERTLPRVVRASFCQAVLSPRTVSEQTRGPSGELHSSSSSSPSPSSVPAEVAASKALSVHNALEASSSWQPPLPPSTPASPSANQKRHIRMSRRTHARAQTHTRRNLLIKKCISWRPTPKRNPAGRNWNNLLAYKFSLTVSPRLFISVIGNVSNVAKLTKSNSFDQKMNLARLSVCRCPAGRRDGGGGTNKTERLRLRLRERQTEREII